MTHPEPEPVTAVVAARVRQLRRSAGLSQAQLGERMAGSGAEWSRTTVAKLEAGRRNSVSAGELLTLALVFDVPPIWLLADPAERRAIPIADGIEVDPWSALLWMIGRRALRSDVHVADGNWSHVEKQITAALQVMEIADAIEASRNKVYLDSLSADAGKRAELRRQAEADDRDQLAFLAHLLSRFEQWGVVAPPIPEYVADRADELGVKLPDQEG